MTSPAATPAGEPGAGSLSVTIDGMSFSARPGELIIEAAERAGVFVPRFCYHPRMKPVGMCRMCLVEVSGPRGFGLQPACYLRVSEGQEIRTSSPKARKAQEGVLEFLLLNHPLDCPVCDKGGECPLQDQALSHGPGETRFIEEKRHWAKPIEIGPLVHLDRERCIQCARCTRFAEEIAGEALIDFAFRGEEIEVATFPGRPFGSYFSGNTVQICPVGALTSAPYRFKARPWDLEQVETTCTTCSVGCRVVAQSSAGRLVRYLGVDADEVNQSFLCDKGRYGFEANTAPSRLTAPQSRSGEGHVAVRWTDALRQVAAAARHAGETRGPSSIAVLGGARFTNEDAYAWSKLAKSVLLTDSVDAQLDDGLDAELVLGLPRASIADTVGARLVVLLAPDLREELPVLYLRLRTAAVHEGLRLLECSAVPTALSPEAALRVGYLPGEAGRLASALVADEEAGDIPGVDRDALELARALVRDAVGPDERGVERGTGIVVVLGRPSLAEGRASYEEAASLLHASLPGARFLPALRRANVHGALDMGLAPGVLPGRVGLEEARAWFEDAWGALPETRGRDARAILEAAAAGEISLLVLLGADPIADFPDTGLAREALGRVDTLVAVGSHWDESARLADVVLPVAGADERTGSTTNLEGRVSRVAQKVVPPGTAWPAWTVAVSLAHELGSDIGLENLETISEEIEHLAPSHRGVDVRLLGRPAYRDGVIVPLAQVPVHLGVGRPDQDRPRPIDPIATPGIMSVEEQGAPLGVGHALPRGGSAADMTVPTALDRGLHPQEPGSQVSGPRQRAGAPTMKRPPLLSWGTEREAKGAPRLDSYSLRLVLRRTLYDQGTLVMASPSLSALRPAPELAVHPGELARLGLGDGDRLRVRGPGGDLEVRATGDPSTPRNVAVLAAHLAGEASLGAEVLLGGDTGVTDVRLETI